MKKVLALGVGGVLLLGVTVVGAAVLDDQDSAAMCLPGGAAVTVSVDGLPEEIAGYSGDALRNAAVIAQVGQEQGFGKQGQLVALITAMQESQLGNHPSTASPDENGDAGVFQQRQLDGWYGSLEEVNDITYAATAFYNGVTAESEGDYGTAGGGAGYGHIPGLTDISGWESMEPAAAAQAVQRSAHPDAYAEHLDEAEAILAGLANANVSVDSASTSDAGGASDSGGDHCAAPTVEATGDAAEALARGRTLLGTPYEFGGGGKHGPDTGIDCSGFVLFAFGLDSNEIGRTAQAQFDSLASTSVPPDQIQPGDLIFYAKGRTGAVGSPNAISHVAIYSGDGKMIESTRYNGGTEPGVQEIDAQVEDGRGFVDVRRLPSTTEEPA